MTVKDTRDTVSREVRSLAVDPGTSSSTGDATSTPASLLHTPQPCRPAT
jgi:hypothetical protein